MQKFYLMINTFRVISILEGLSYILLLFIAVPIKYLSNDELYVKILGMPHGLLFMAYILLAFILKPDMKWSNKEFSFVLAASVIPFGTFYIERKYLRVSS